MHRALPGLAIVAALVAGAFAVHALVPAASVLTAAVVLGVIIANTTGVPPAAGPGIALAGKRVLRVGVALLGAGLSFEALAALGLPGLLAVTAVVAITIGGVLVLARLLGVSTDLALLIGAGYGICGASAIAAVRPHTHATDGETSYAVALVALCGSLSIAVLPAIAALLGLGDVAFGRWAGAAVHDVGQVVATAGVRGATAVDAAIIVKLARVALLAPVVLLFTLRNRARTERADVARVAPLPGFVVGFLALAALNTLGAIPVAIAGPIAFAAKFALALGLAALGLGVRWQALRAIGVQPFILGLAAWGLVAAAAYPLAILNR